MLNFFITPAYAEPAVGFGGDYSFLLLTLGMVVIFYFLLWRPQSKRAKEHKNLIANIAKGDEVITTGGLLGRVNKVTDDFIVVQVGDNTDLTFQKGSVSAVLPKGTLKSIHQK